MIKNVMNVANTLFIIQKDIYDNIFLTLAHRNICHITLSNR